MANEPILLLTPLRKGGHNFKDATGFGSWQPISGTLGELGGALDVDEKAQVDVVRSTPDPWAQARSFADAILNPAHRSGALVAQWRGLIALFGLSAYYEDVYKLSLVAVPLSGRSSRFASVMTHLLPQTSLAAPDGDVSHAWDRPIIVRLFELDKERRPTGAGRDLGILNPASLVAAGRDGEAVRVAGIPWMLRGITDPTRLVGNDALPPVALQMLGDYVQRLDGEVAKMCLGRGGADQQAFLKNLRDRLQSFRDDCLDVRLHPDVGTRTVTIEPGEQWGEGLPHLYELLASPMRAKAPEPGTSDCIIRLRDDLGDAPPFKGLVLLDPALATVDRPASRIGFWGTKTLHQVISGTVSEQAGIRKIIAEAGYLMVTPDDLLTRVLVTLDDDERPARIASHPDGLHNCLLPFSPLVLLIRKPDELASSTSVNRDGKVQLALSVSGRPHVVSRRYVEAPQGTEGRLLREVDWGLGDFALWPNFRSDVWRHYCARIDYSSNSLNRLRGRFAMSGRLLADFMRDAQSPERRADHMAPWANSAPLDNRGTAAVLDRIPEFEGRKFVGPGLTRLRASNSGGRASEIQISTTPYEAAFFSVAVDPNEPPYPAGLSVLHIPEVANPNDRIGVAAIDFGTTNTVACLNETVPLRLAARIVHPVEPANDKGSAFQASELNQKFRDFLPADERSLPSPTVIIGRPLDAPGRELLDADGALNDALLIRHLMYFQPDFAEDGTISAIPIKEWSALLNNIKYNLKWSSAPEMRDAARRFLRQLMLMIACEWTAKGGNPANLKWHFSRPKDMGDDADFLRQLKLALADVVPTPAADAVRPIRYEGDAAAAYILDENTKAQGTRGAVNIILDIGGGTTDIAIWDNGKPIKQLFSTSMRLAGGDFFTDHIMRNPEILEDFGLKAWSSVIQQLNKESDAELRANIHYIGELLFSGRTLDNAIEREWSRVSGTDNVRSLKETSYLFLGGLAWFVGRLLRNLIRDGEIPRSALGDIAVAFCGRGSGLFVRLHGPDPRAQTEISKLMLLIAVAAGETRPAYPQVQVSPFPKIEVAAGMIIAARDDQFIAPASADATHAGIDFGDEVGAEPTVLAETPEDQVYSALPLDVGIEDLDPFLRAFARVSGFTVSIDDNQRAKLINGVADIDREDERDGRPRQSEFAAVLKALVGLIRLKPSENMRPKTVWK
ncbi:hypothetical protein E5673_10325 [Sphingomonas sp. PAMC26645]|uniref:hypothetical protein n=1 Tax=Sphingomonas sp. PAMC26645 TaxID=2565555 RepID=UPI00109D8949|nr:hypothetical protein [Sphingomonas sp. PAMC26645]QCB42575.1 hypothetical protein E5673_10325 [Sphingomonas sp. PAMC26645]